MLLQEKEHIQKLNKHAKKSSLMMTPHKIYRTQHMSPSNRVSVADQNMFSKLESIAQQNR